MIIKTEADISKIVLTDEWMMDVLRAAEELGLPDWWIGAGFLRNKVWDAIEGVVPEPTRDIDLVYFDDKNIEPKTDWGYDEYMKTKFPFAQWEVRNQARMHYVNNFAPYKSTADGIAHWVETATCVGVRLQQGTLGYLFCYGTADLLGLIARPTEGFRPDNMINIFHDRIAKKGWQTRWPTLKILEN